MTDLNKEREAFEGKFPKPHWIEWDEELGQYTSKHVSDVGYQARFEVWLEAKAQAVPEKKIYLTCEQLYAAANFGAPNKDPELLETELTIAWFDEAHSGSGYYVYISEYPEEGAMKLESESGAKG
ncbi:TPA: hypothetical protein OMQ00_003750 [Acinetobacter baumannii]|nr:hypothetical protein [Acinetobacter baumannii]